MADLLSLCQVIVCGGGSCVPAVQRAVNAMFKNAEFLNQQSPEEVVAIGASKQVIFSTSNSGIALGKREIFVNNFLISP